eukprot:scaffold25122_cov66-Phaeocystis_antarctica.AAC.5
MPAGMITAAVTPAMTSMVGARRLSRALGESALRACLVRTTLWQVSPTLIWSSRSGPSNGPSKTWPKRPQGRVLTGAHGPTSSSLGGGIGRAPRQPLSMAISYTALAAWAADANAKIELIDRDECWIDVIVLTDADAAHMLQKVQSEASGLIYDTGNKRMLERLQRMTRVLQHRTQLGAALVQQRLSTDAALGSLSVLTYDTRQLIVRLAGERAKDLAAIARTSSSFRVHASTAAVAKDQAWAAQAAGLRLLTSLTQVAPPPPGSLCDLYQRFKPFDQPPPIAQRVGLIKADALLLRRCAPSDFLISVEFWWDGKLFGATCGELGV